MFKQAFVRGLQNTLIQSGYASFPSEVDAAKVADYIAERIDFDPTTKVAKETSLKIANYVIEASKSLHARGVKAASFDKVASVDDLEKLAHQHTMDLMNKAAEGSTIEGGDKGNTEPSSAEGKMDLAARPNGYATDSLGKSDVDTRPGAVGKEQEQPNKPSESPAGSNSITDQSKTSALGSMIRKLAEGSTILGGDKGNKEPTTGEGKMDAAMRPEGYAVLPSQGALGEMMNHFSAQSAVGKEQAHPNKPAESPSGSNSLIATSAKSAAEDPYIALFKKTAAEVAEYLPAGLSETQKVAQVRACMGMNTEEKAQYLIGLQKSAADASSHSSDATHGRAGAYDGRKANQGGKKIAEMPAFIQEKIDAKKNESGDSEKKDEEKGEHKNPFAKKDDGDEKKDEKKDDETKEGSLIDHFRQIASTVS